MKKMPENNMINDQELEQVTGGDKFWNWIKNMEKKEQENLPEAEVAFMDSGLNILVPNDFGVTLDPEL